MLILLKALHINLTNQLFYYSAWQIRLYLPLPTWSNPTGQTSRHLPLCKYLEFWHLVHAVLSVAEQKRQSFVFSMQSPVLALHSRLNLPVPTSSYPSGQVSWHLPAYRYLWCWHLVQTLLSLSQNRQWLDFSIHVSAGCGVVASGTMQVRLNLPLPTAIVPTGQASRHTPSYRYLEFIHLEQIPSVQNRQSLRFSTHSGVEHE